MGLLTRVNYDLVNRYPSSPGHKNVRMYGVVVPAAVAVLVVAAMTVIVAVIQVIEWIVEHMTFEHLDLNLQRPTGTGPRSKYRS